MKNAGEDSLPVFGSSVAGHARVVGVFGCQLCAPCANCGATLRVAIHDAERRATLVAALLR